MPQKPIGISQETAEAYALLGIPYEGYVKGIGYQSLMAQTLGSCYFQERGCAIPQFVPVMDSSPEMRVKSVGHKHKVNVGETLISISQQYGVTIGSIMAANPSIDWSNARNNGGLVFVGETLALPNLVTQEALPKDASGTKCVFPFATSNEVRGMMEGGSSLTMGAMEVDAISGAAIICKTPYVGRNWQMGMPTLYNDGEILLVVSRKTNTYLSIMDSNLKKEFDTLHRQKRNIPGNLYMSPIASYKFFGGLMSAFSSQGSPLVGVELKDFPYLSILRPDATFLNTINSLDSDLNKYEVRLKKNRLNWYLKYEMIY